MPCRRDCKGQSDLHQIDFDYRGFEWIDCHNHDDSRLSYIRRAKDPSDFLVIACNFTPVPRLGYHLGVPEQCWYEEIFNSDSSFYAGSNLGNGPGVQAENWSSHGRPASIRINYAPLGVSVFKPRR
jgi:1,4-alpha-glucan branching enzyme